MSDSISVSIKILIRYNICKQGQMPVVIVESRRLYTRAGLHSLAKLTCFAERQHAPPMCDDESRQGERGESLTMVKEKLPDIQVSVKRCTLLFITLTLKK
jgi:hypothetical protein